MVPSARINMSLGKENISSPHMEFRKVLIYIYIDIDMCIYTFFNGYLVNEIGRCSKHPDRIFFITRCIYISIGAKAHCR